MTREEQSISGKKKEKKRKKRKKRKKKRPFIIHIAMNMNTCSSEFELFSDYLPFSVTDKRGKSLQNENYTYKKKGRRHLEGKSFVTSYINIAQRRSKHRNLTHNSFLQTHQHITFDIDPIMHAPEGSGLPLQSPQQHQPQPHHPIRLIHHQPICHLQRHWHRLATQHRRQRHRAVLPVVQRRQHGRRRDGLVPVRHERRKPVVVYGDSLVGVPRDDGELHVGGDEWRGCGVEVVDGDAHHRELWFLGTIHQPHHQSCDAC